MYFPPPKPKHTLEVKMTALDFKSLHFFTFQSSHFTCDWFVASYTLFSVQVAKTFEAVRAVVAGSEMLAG